MDYITKLYATGLSLNNDTFRLLGNIEMGSGCHERGQWGRKGGMVLYVGCQRIGNDGTRVRPGHQTYQGHFVKGGSEMTGKEK